MTQLNGCVSYRRREATGADVEYQMGYAKKREDQQDFCPDNCSIETVCFVKQSTLFDIDM